MTAKTQPPAAADILINPAFAYLINSPIAVGVELAAGVPPHALRRVHAHQARRKPSIMVQISDGELFATKVNLSSRLRRVMEAAALWEPMKMIGAA